MSFSHINLINLIPGAHSPFPLWPGSPPGALGNDKERDIPGLTPYVPAAGNNQGAAMIICPGGGYGHLAAHEGADYALWLSEQGITCFVLQYRLGTHGYQHPVMLYDIQHAIRYVRSHATSWGVDTGRIGVMGSSAGGHLAATAMTHFDAGNADSTDAVERVSSRPDLGILCYPVISMGYSTHGGSRSNLLGPTPSPQLIELLSNELQVTEQTPPCFIWHTRDDEAVKVENSLEFASVLQRNGVAFDLHIYQQGRHGLGLGAAYTPGQTHAEMLHPWTQNLLHWLRVQDFIR